MAKFCPECGGPLVSETSKFCDKCGANTGEANTDRQNRVIDNPQKNYSTNYILILLFVLYLIFCAINLIFGLIIWMIIAIAVYYDAKSIRAGKSSQKEGWYPMTYKPLSWGLLTFFTLIIGLSLYLYKRKKIFNQNL